MELDAHTRVVVAMNVGPCKLMTRCRLSNRSHAYPRSVCPSFLRVCSVLEREVRVHGEAGGEGREISRKGTTSYTYNC